MEKLLDFKKGHPSEFPSKMYRFQCDCLTASDAMDIDMEACGESESEKFITIRMDFYGTGLLDRLKYAFAILKGHWNWREFIVRPEDYQSLSDIFDPIKKYMELP